MFMGGRSIFAEMHDNTITPSNRGECMEGEYATYQECPRKGIRIESSSLGLCTTSESAGLVRV
jgi:hypothetical protein